jgi:hypothetical protein
LGQPQPFLAALPQANAWASLHLLGQSDTCLLQELGVFRSTALMQAVNQIISLATPILITVVTLWSYTAVFGRTLTPSTAFTALQLLAVMQGPLQQFPNVINSVLVDGGAALGRMGAFLQVSVMLSSLVPQHGLHSAY